MPSEEINPTDRFVDEATQSLEGRLLALDSRVLETHPLETYISLLDQCPEIAGHSWQSPELARFRESIRASVSDEGLELYHQRLLLELIKRSRSRLIDSDLPLRIRELHEENFQRIVRNIARRLDPPGVYSFPEFSKELGLCGLRFLPCGVFKVHLHGLPRRILLQRDLSQSVAGVRLAIELGGLKPLYEGHLDSRDAKAMLQFNRVGWIRSFRIIADLLKVRPEAKGFFGISWLHDPQLKELSPSLRFIPDLVEEIGGVILKGRPSGPSGVANALWMSPQREKLYSEGKYIPHDSPLVIPRKRLLAWADRQV